MRVLYLVDVVYAASKHLPQITQKENNQNLVLSWGHAPHTIDSNHDGDSDGSAMMIIATQKHIICLCVSGTQEWGSHNMLDFFFYFATDIIIQYRTQCVHKPKQYVAYAPVCVHVCACTLYGTYILP